MQAARIFVARRVVLPATAPMIFSYFIECEDGPQAQRQATPLVAARHAREGLWSE